jgi:hypothetical protein
MLQRASWQTDGNKVRVAEYLLSEAIETLCYSYLEQEHGGWENNDGAFGTFELDIAAWCRANRSRQVN